jgi:hypothetical protein
MFTAQFATLHNLLLFPKKKSSTHETENHNEREGVSDDIEDEEEEEEASYSTLYGQAWQNSRDYGIFRYRYRNSKISTGFIPESFQALLSELASLKEGIKDSTPFPIF